MGFHQRFHLDVYSQGVCFYILGGPTPFVRSAAHGISDDHVRGEVRSEEKCETSEQVTPEREKSERGITTRLMMIRSH